MKLTDLEFHELDFEHIEGYAAMSSKPLYIAIRDVANRLLKERLDKNAMEVYCWEGNMSFWHAGPDDGELCGEETHSARAVCIEEIKGQESDE